MHGPRRPYAPALGIHAQALPPSAWLASQRRMFALDASKDFHLRYVGWDEAHGFLNCLF
jgi:hypothetical protein